MKIFILEDDEIQRQQLKEVISQLVAKMQLSIKKIVATDNPQELLDELEVIDDHHVYFLDLKINDNPRKGLEVAKEIRKRDAYGSIIFVSTHTELALKTFAYKVSKLDFIAKDQSKEDFRQQIEDCLKALYEHGTKNKKAEDLIIENQLTAIRVPFADVLYIETTSTPHKLNLVTKKSVISFYGRLREVVVLHESLFQCHKSFVVNVENIVKVDKKKKIVYFDKGKSCFVSRRLLKELQQQWLK